MLPPQASTHTPRERGGSPLFLSAQAAPLEPGKPIYVFQFNIVLSDVLGEVVAFNKLNLVPSDGWELIDTGVDEKAFEAGHPESHHLLEGRDVAIFTNHQNQVFDNPIATIKRTLRLGAFPSITPPPEEDRVAKSDLNSTDAYFATKN